MPVKGSRVSKPVKNKGLISDLEKKAVDLTDNALKLQEDIHRWKEWQAYYCYVFQEAYKRTLEKMPSSSYSVNEENQWSACEKYLKDILAANKFVGIIPKRIPVDFQEYTIWEQEHVFHPKFYLGAAWLPYRTWGDEWERLTDIIHKFEQRQRYYDSVGSYDIHFYMQLWVDLKRERNRLGRVVIQIIRNSKFAFLENSAGSPGLIPSPDALRSADLNLSPPLRTGRPDLGPLLNTEEISLQQELFQGVFSFPNDHNGHLKFLLAMDNIVLQHIWYAHDWLQANSKLVHRSDEQINTLRKTYDELAPWKKASQDSIDALNMYATTFQDDHEHEIHMKARLAAQKQNIQMARTEKLQEKYTAWHEILVEKKEGYELDGVEGRNIIERNGLVRTIIRHRVKQISAKRAGHSEAKYDATIIDTVTLVAKRNYLDIELEGHISRTENKYGEDQALILRQQRRKYTEWRELEFQGFYKKTRPKSHQSGEVPADFEPLFSTMSRLENDENLENIAVFKDILDQDYTRFKQLCLEAGFWAEAKELPLSTHLSQHSSASNISINPDNELAKYLEAGASIRAFLTSPDIAPEFDTEFFRNDVETFINRCSNFLATPLQAAQREQWRVFLKYCTQVKDLFEVDNSNMVRRIEAGWGFYWKNPVAGPVRRPYDVSKPWFFDKFREWVISSRWLLDFGGEEAFRRDVPKQVLYQELIKMDLGIDSSFAEFRSIINYCHGKRQLFLMTPGNNIRRINVGWPEEMQRPKNYDTWFKPMLMGARKIMQIIVGTKTTANQLYKDFQKAETNPRIKLPSQSRYRMGDDEFLNNLTFAIDHCEMFMKAKVDEDNNRSDGGLVLVIIGRGWAKDGWDGAKAGGSNLPRKK